MSDGEFVRTAPVGRLPRVWSVIAFVSVAAGMLLTFDPDFASVRSTAVTLIPFVLLAIIGVAAASLPERGTSRVFTITTLAAVVGWAVLMFDDGRWSILAFALFGLCFSVEGVTGVAIACSVAAVWTAAWIDDGVDGWRLMVPIATFGAGVTLWSTLRRAEHESAALAALLEQVETTSAELAAAEHERGVLAERARVAGEIHDTLAQGFTSIVVLSRAARRTGSPGDALDEIEVVALEHLDAARRLVDAIGPAELEAASLPDAVRRHVEASIDSERTSSRVTISGEPHPLPADVEVTMFRGLQEALLNVRRHARARHVDVTLTYLGNGAALDVRDDGCGFGDGGDGDSDLIGGQGLRALRNRVEGIGGTLALESTEHGTVVSLQVPGRVT